VNLALVGPADLELRARIRLSEAISPLAGAGYSVRLYRLVYDRCNP
jgi:hypothetical protein